MEYFLWGAAGLLISTGMWVWILRRYDKWQPEPLKVLLRVGFWGGCMSILPAILCNILADHFLGLGGVVSDLSQKISLPLALTSAVWIGINEETWKFLATVHLVKKLPEFDEPLDGMIYAMTVALGFAAIENLGYMVSLGPGVIIARALLSIPIHLACGVMWGYGIARARFISKTKNYVKAALPYLLAAAGVHAAFDFFLFLRTWTVLLVFPLLFFMVWHSNKRLLYLRDQSLCLNENICQHCQERNTALAKYCINCGLPLSTGGEFFQICASCQARVPRNDNYCFNCGAKLTEFDCL
jgi:RsiW-degrading membrane proteinase PrsW (M82 family)